jgi:hypothetical protein
MKLFTKLKSESTFCNFYQLAQVVKWFGDAWGFVVSMQSGLQLVCFYGKCSRKDQESTVSPSQQRVKASLKHGCPLSSSPHTIRLKRTCHGIGYPFVSLVSPSTMHAILAWQKLELQRRQLVLSLGN